MADTYFCFSDECGDYQPRMSEKQLRSHPFYVRTTLIMNSSEWKALNQKFRLLKEKYLLPLSKELKWAHLWSLRSFQKSGKKIPHYYDIKYLEGTDYHLLIDFVEESLGLLATLNEKKIIATYTKNTSQTINEKAMLSFHLQEHMQRIEMELHIDPDNLGVLFFDPVNNNKDKLYRELYNKLYEDGDFIEKYTFIKDSLNIENSHHSVGIQIADYISGSFSSILKASIDNDYSRGVKMFYDHVHPNLRHSWNDTIQGYGIREVPRNKVIRDWMIAQMNTFKPKTGS